MRATRPLANSTAANSGGFGNDLTVYKVRRAAKNATTTSNVRTSTPTGLASSASAAAPNVTATTFSPIAVMMALANSVSMQHQARQQATTNQQQLQQQKGVQAPINLFMTGQGSTAAGHVPTPSQPNQGGFPLPNQPIPQQQHAGNASMGMPQQHQPSPASSASGSPTFDTNATNAALFDAFRAAEYQLGQQRTQEGPAAPSTTTQSALPASICTAAVRKCAFTQRGLKHLCPTCLFAQTGSDAIPDADLLDFAVAMKLLGAMGAGSGVTNVVGSFYIFSACDRPAMHCSGQTFFSLDSSDSLVGSGKLLHALTTASSNGKKLAADADPFLSAYVSSATASASRVGKEKATGAEALNTNSAADSAGMKAGTADANGLPTSDAPHIITAEELRRTVTVISGPTDLVACVSLAPHLTEEIIVKYLETLQEESPTMVTSPDNPSPSSVNGSGNKAVIDPRKTLYAQIAVFVLLQQVTNLQGGDMLNCLLKTVASFPTVDHIRQALVRETIAANPPKLDAKGCIIGNVPLGPDGLPLPPPLPQLEERLLELAATYQDSVSKTVIKLLHSVSPDEQLRLFVNHKLQGERPIAAGAEHDLWRSVAFYLHRKRRHELIKIISGLDLTYVTETVVPLLLNIQVPVDGAISADKLLAAAANSTAYSDLFNNNEEEDVASGIAPTPAPYSYPMPATAPTSVFSRTIPPNEVHAVMNDLAYSLLDRVDAVVRSSDITMSLTEKDVFTLVRCGTVLGVLCDANKPTISERFGEDPYSYDAVITRNQQKEFLERCRDINLRVPQSFYEATLMLEKIIELAFEAPSIFTRWVITQFNLLYAYTLRRIAKFAKSLERDPNAMHMKKDEVQHAAAMILEDSKRRMAAAVASAAGAAAGSKVHTGVVHNPMTSAGAKGVALDGVDDTEGNGIAKPPPQPYEGFDDKDYRDDATFYDFIDMHNAVPTTRLEGELTDEDSSVDDFFAGFEDNGPNSPPAKAGAAVGTSTSSYKSNRGGILGALDPNTRCASTLWWAPTATTPITTFSIYESMKHKAIENPLAKKLLAEYGEKLEEIADTAGESKGFVSAAPAFKLITKSIAVLSSHEEIRQTALMYAMLDSTDQLKALIHKELNQNVMMPSASIAILHDLVRRCPPKNKCYTILMSALTDLLVPPSASRSRWDDYVVMRQLVRSEHSRGRLDEGTHRALLRWTSTNATRSVIFSLVSVRMVVLGLLFLGYYSGNSLEGGLVRRRLRRKARKDAAAAATARAAAAKAGVDPDVLPTSRFAPLMPGETVFVSRQDSVALLANANPTLPPKGLYGHRTATRATQSPFALKVMGTMYTSCPNDIMRDLAMGFRESLPSFWTGIFFLYPIYSPAVQRYLVHNVCGSEDTLVVLTLLKGASVLNGAAVERIRKTLGPLCTIVFVADVEQFEGTIEGMHKPVNSGRKAPPVTKHGIAPVVVRNLVDAAAVENDQQKRRLAQQFVVAEQPPTNTSTVANGTTTVSTVTSPAAQGTPLAQPTAPQQSATPKPPAPKGLFTHQQLVSSFYGIDIPVEAIAVGALNKIHCLRRAVDELWGALPPSVTVDAPAKVKAVVPAVAAMVPQSVADVVKAPTDAIASRLPDDLGDRTAKVTTTILAHATDAQLKAAKAMKQTVSVPSAVSHYTDPTRLVGHLGADPFADVLQTVTDIPAARSIAERATAPMAVSTPHQDRLIDVIHRLEKEQQHNYRFGRADPLLPTFFGVPIPFKLVQTLATEELKGRWGLLPLLSETAASSSSTRATVRSLTEKLPTRIQQKFIPHDLDEIVGYTTDKATNAVEATNSFLRRPLPMKPLVSSMLLGYEEAVRAMRQRVPNAKRFVEGARKLEQAAEDALHVGGVSKSGHAAAEAVEASLLTAAENNSATA